MNTAAPGASGLLFSYYDSTGAALAAATASGPKVARVKISVRGQAQQMDVSGMPKGTYDDSLVMDVGVRNRQ